MFRREFEFTFRKNYCNRQTATRPAHWFVRSTLLWKSTTSIVPTMFLVSEDLSLVPIQELFGKTCACPEAVGF